MKHSASVIDILKSVNAVLVNDHFVYTSGKHGSVYINKDALYPHVKQTSQVCKMMAEQCAHLDIETVAAPALGGIILSQWVGHHLSVIKQKPIHAVYAEKDGQGGFVFKRGYDRYIKNKRVLVLEDLATTGGSVKKVVDVVRSYEGKVTGVCVMVNRNPQQVNQAMFDAPFFYLGELQAEAWDEDELPDELKQKPINTEVGHGREYLAKQAKNQ
jgi:orotate phosphoribosyltransferase